MIQNVKKLRYSNISLVTRWLLKEKKNIYECVCVCIIFNLIENFKLIHFLNYFIGIKKHYIYKKNYLQNLN